MRCRICRKAVEETFLKKILGTYIKDKKSKKQVICKGCQKKLKTREEILKKL